MYVLKVIRIFLSLLEICYVYPNIQKRVKAKSQHMKRLGWISDSVCSFGRCSHAEKWYHKEHVQIISHSSTLPKKRSFNQFKGKSEHEESFSRWNKVFKETETPKIPSASQGGGSIYSLGTNTSFPLSVPKIWWLWVWSHLSWFLHPTGSSPS